MQCIIYAITNIVTKRRYVGSTVNAENRWKQHQHLLKQNRHHCTHLQNSYNKHGKKNFKFSIIRILMTADTKVRMAAELEEIARFPSFNTLKASFDLQSFETPPEVRAKKSAAAKRNWQDEKVREKRLNRTFSEEELARRVEFMTAFWAGPEGELTKAKQRAAVQAYWTPEAREEKARKQKEYRHSDETKEKMAKSGKKAWINPTEAMKGIAAKSAASWTDPKARKLRSERMKASWANPEIRKLRHEKAKAAWIVRRQKGTKPCKRPMPSPTPAAAQTAFAFAPDE